MAQLEAAGRIKAVITQNIDGLHQTAGSKNVLELHGSNWRQYCTRCGARYGLEYILDDAHCPDGTIPICDRCGAIVRPDVVLYGEELNYDVIRASIKAIAAADMLIVGGTSLSVYPAAGLLSYFKGDALVLINKTETQADGKATLVIREPIIWVISMPIKRSSHHCRRSSQSLL